MSAQIDVFRAAPGSGRIVGLKIKLDRPVDRERPCCRNIAVICEGRGQHSREFRCIDCDQHRGWLSQTTAGWIESVVVRFGAPTTPIIVRPTSLEQKEGRTTETK